MLALIYILKGPSETILYGTGAEKAVLVFVYNFEHDYLQPIGQYLCYDFQAAVEERYRSKVIGCLRGANLSDEGDVS